MIQTEATPNPDSLKFLSEKTISVNFATSDGTATANNDYISASGTLEFAPGVITQTIPVTMVQDSLDEINETITVTLSGESNATVADATGIITITDDDGTPTLSISPLTTVETGTLSATVSLSGASSEDVTVNYATSNGTANAGNDYTSTTGIIPLGNCRHS